MAGERRSAAASGDGTFWRKVNDMALANLGAWVPEIFGDDAKFQKGTGAYRVSSKALGRNLEEDLSIHPKGITDWGLDDQGKKGEKIGRRTAIDIVIEHGGAADAKQAAFWLCEQMAVDPASLGWKAGRRRRRQRQSRDRAARCAVAGGIREGAQAGREGAGLPHQSARRHGRAGCVSPAATRVKPMIEIDELNADHAWCSPATRRR